MPHPHQAQLRAEFESLLRELDATWPPAALEYVREDLSHAEFGEALENLAALAAEDGHPLRPRELKRIEALAAQMELSDSPHVVRLLAGK